MLPNYSIIIVWYIIWMAIIVFHICISVIVFSDGFLISFSLFISQIQKIVKQILKEAYLV